MKLNDIKDEIKKLDSVIEKRQKNLDILIKRRNNLRTIINTHDFTAKVKTISACNSIFLTIEHKDKTTNVIDRFLERELEFIVIRDVFTYATPKGTFNLDLVVAEKQYGIKFLQRGKHLNPTFTDFKDRNLWNTFLDFNEQHYSQNDKFYDIECQIRNIPLEKFGESHIPFSKPCIFLAQDTTLYKEHKRECYEFLVVGIIRHRIS